MEGVYSIKRRRQWCVVFVMFTDILHKVYYRRSSKPVDGVRWGAAGKKFQTKKIRPRSIKRPSDDGREVWKTQPTEYKCVGGKERAQRINVVKINVIACTHCRYVRKNYFLYLILLVFVRILTIINVFRRRNTYYAKSPFPSIEFETHPNYYHRLPRCCSRISDRTFL